MDIVRSAIITVGDFGEELFSAKECEALYHEINNDHHQGTWLQVHIDDSTRKNCREEVTGNKLSSCVVHSRSHEKNDFNTICYVGADAARQIKRTCRKVAITLILVREQYPDALLAALQIAELSQEERTLTFVLRIGSKQGENTNDNAQSQTDCRYIDDQLNKLTDVVVQINEQYLFVPQKKNQSHCQMRTGDSLSALSIRLYLRGLQ